MTDGSHRPTDRFILVYTEEELWAFAKLMQRRRDRGPAWDSYWSVIFVVILAVGFAPYGALWLGLIRPAAFQPVLATAYLAFVAGGFTYWIVMAVRTRNLARAGHRDAGSPTWTLVFDELGLSCKNERLETRIPWLAVERVEDAGTMVLIWMNPAQATHLPARAFADATARTAFVERTAGRIAAARAALTT